MGLKSSKQHIQTLVFVEFDYIFYLTLHNAKIKVIVMAKFHDF